MSKKEIYQDYHDLMLPDSVVTKADLARLTLELERVDDAMTTRSIRSRVSKHHAEAPIMSSQLIDFLDLNSLSLNQSKDRSKLIKNIRLLKDKTPVLHMTFASTADSSSLEKLVSWARSNTSPQTVLSVGIQPSLVAGVYVRTPNHIYDFSARKSLEGKHDSLVKAIHGSQKVEVA